MMYSDALQAFIRAIQNAGLTPPQRILPGKWHRFLGVGKPLSNRAGWCYLFADGSKGSFGDWAAGWVANWQAHSPKVAVTQKPSAMGAQHHSHRCSAALPTSEHTHTREAEKAARIWQRATSADPQHPYLVTKRIQVHGARCYQGVLVLPIVDITGELINLQCIDAKGNKRLLKGGRKQGGFITIAPQPNNRQCTIVCEGWATGCTLAEEYNASAVIAAIDAGNLNAIATTLRCHWPDALLIIAGDDDRLVSTNPGRTKAYQAAINSHAELMLPNWPDDAPDTLTDFNDLACWLEQGGAYGGEI